MRSLTIGLRLCGIADEPFWAPARNGSSTSRTSVRCRWRTSVAKRSSPAPASAIALEQLGVAVARHHLRRHVLAREAQPLEHGGLHLGAVGRVGAHGAGERAHRHALTARSRRRRLRSASNAKPASLTPKVVGSACTPCVRPTQRVSTCSRARRTSASR